MLVFKTLKQAVNRLTFSADGSRIAVAGSGKKVHIWNLTVAKHKRTVLTALSPAVLLAFRPDGKLLAVTQWGRALLHDLTTGASEFTRPDSPLWVNDLVAAPDVSTFYGTGHHAMKWTFNNGLRRVWEERTPGYPNQHGLGASVLTPNGEYIAIVGNLDNTAIHMRDAATGALRAAAPLGESSINGLILLPDGRTLVFLDTVRGASAPSKLRVGTVESSFEAVRTYQDDYCTTLALHPSGRWLAVGQWDGLVRVLDTRDWSEVTAYRWAPERVQSLAFAPDGLKAAAGFGIEGKVVVWDVDL